MVRILHFADLHLDRSFAGLSVAPSEAAKRREELRTALRRIIDLALELNVDAPTGTPAPSLPDSLYWRLQWPANVHIFQSMSWEAVDLSDSVTIWGAGHKGPAIRDNLVGALTA